MCVVHLFHAFFYDFLTCSTPSIVRLPLQELGVNETPNFFLFFLFPFFTCVMYLSLLVCQCKNLLFFLFALFFFSCSIFVFFFCIIKVVAVVLVVVFFDKLTDIKFYCSLPPYCCQVSRYFSTFFLFAFVFVRHPSRMLLKYITKYKERANTVILPMVIYLFKHLFTPPNFAFPVIIFSSFCCLV